MNTEKEILLNKEEIKALESKIKNDEIFISKEGHNFTRIDYEHNLLNLEATNFVDNICRSKEDFVKTSLDVLNNPKNNTVEFLRRNIVNLRDIYEHIDYSLSEKGQLIERTKNKINSRFDAPYLTLKEGFLSSSACSLDIKHILDFVELLDYCEFEKDININNEKNVRYKIDCLIKGKNDNFIAIELDKNFKTFKSSIEEKDEKKKKEYLFEYAKGLKEQINQLSNLEYKKNNAINDKFKLDNLILYIPNETALIKLIEIDSEIIKYASEKNIELTFPTTFLAITYYISLSHSPKGITQQFKKFEKVHKLLLENKREEIQLNQNKIDKLLKINFEYLKAPSYQVKVTLNHEENYVLEEIVNTKGSNKSSVLRQILMEYNEIYKERDALKVAVAQFNLEKKLLEEDRNMAIKVVKQELDIALIEERFRTEQCKTENASLKDECYRKDEMLKKTLHSIEESIRNNQPSLKEDVRKKVVQVINPKEISEFGNIMELITQDVLILCDTSSIPKNDQQRFLDMVYGGVYGLKGKIKEVTDKVFLYVPQNFDLIDV